MVPDIRPRTVVLRVPDLDESLAFYRGLLGLAPADPGSATDTCLAPGRESACVLRLEEASAASAPPRRVAGLFHLALRVPGRDRLARVLVGLRRAGARLQGLSDHGVSEAIYLADPHGNGVEIYADRPRDAWVWEDGEVRMVTRPLDVEDLLAEHEGGEVGDPAEGEPLLPPGTELGHVHLKVTDLGPAEVFYRGVLGFDVTTRSYPGALFFGAGGYHHHVGTNVWGTLGGAPRPEGALGLAEVRFAAADDQAVDRIAGRGREGGFAVTSDEGSAVLRDGDGIRVRVEPATAR